MPNRCWMAAQSPSVPGRLRLTRRRMEPSGISSYDASAAWLVTSMNGGSKGRSASTISSTSETELPRFGGMIS